MNNLALEHAKEALAMLFTFRAYVLLSFILELSAVMGPKLVFNDCSYNLLRSFLPGGTCFLFILHITVMLTALIHCPQEEQGPIHLASKGPISGLRTYYSSLCILSLTPQVFSVNSSHICSSACWGVGETKPTHHRGEPTTDAYMNNPSIVGKVNARGEERAKRPVAWSLLHPTLLAS